MLNGIGTIDFIVPRGFFAFFFFLFTANFSLSRVKKTMIATRIYEQRIDVRKTTAPMTALVMISSACSFCH